MPDIIGRLLAERTCVNIRYKSTDIQRTYFSRYGGSVRVKICRYARATKGVNILVILRHI